MRFGRGELRSLMILMVAVAGTASTLGQAQQTATDNSKTLPAAVDLRPELDKLGLGPRSQGSRPTCSVFTTEAALEFALAKKTGHGVVLSVEYLNWASNDVMKDATDGGFFHDLLKG